MMVETLFVMIICYLAVIAMLIYRIVTAKVVAELKIEPIEIIPQKKDVNSIVAASKSEFLKPPKPKPNPAQVPAEDVPSLFEEDPELEYDDAESKGDEEENNLPEKDEVIGAEEHTEDNAPIDEVEPTRPMCMDYMQMEQTITRMVRGTVSVSDQDFIAQLEGSGLFDQIEQKMTTTNLELVRSILKNI